MEHAPVVLTAVKLGTQHWDTLREPAKRRYDRLRGRGPPKPDPHVTDAQTMEDKGYILRRRSEVQSDEEIVEVVRHRGEVLPRRPRNRRQTSSVDATRYRRDAGGYGSDSEGSVPPRGRKARSTTGRSRRGRSSSSSSSSDLGSSTDENKEIKKLQRKKWITAALASVATIHAASKVYGSIEKHDKRVIAVAEGDLSPEDAHKQARSARWQDAAAIGIAALGIKGAMSEWKEMQEEHARHKELCEQYEQHHKRRLEHERRSKAKNLGGYYKGRDGHWYYDGPELQESQRPRSSARSSTVDTYERNHNLLNGPHQNDRKMIEGPPPRDRGAYGRDRSRARSTYGRDRDDESRSPVRARSRRGSPSRKVSTYDN